MTRTYSSGHLFYSFTEPDLVKKTINFIKSIIIAIAHPAIIIIRIIEVIILATPLSVIFGIREKSNGKSLKR